MKNSATSAFLAAVAAAAVFIVISSQGLPAIVASHFGAEGAANGFMSRGGYVNFMLFVTIGTPLLVVFTPRVIRTFSPQLLNLPNRDYWLAPEREEQTYDYLDAHTLRFGWILTVFLCFVHWLVVDANKAHPPHLSNVTFMGGVIAFFVFVVAWIFVLLVRFRRT